MLRDTSRWFSFRGRADRSELLLVLGAILTLTFVGHSLVGGADWSGRNFLASLLLVVGLISAVIGWAAIFRRLHDVGIRGWPVFLGLVLITGGWEFLLASRGWDADGALLNVIYVGGVLVLGAWRGNAGENRFGPPPAPSTPPPSTPEEIERVRVLRESLARPGLRLKPAEAPAFSKLGGMPELPPSLEWPIGPDGALAFLAQIDLGEARAAGGPDWLPETGVIYLFNDEERYGFPDHVRVLRGVRGERPSARPPGLAEDHEFGERRVQFIATVFKPSSDWLDLPARSLDTVDHGEDDIDDDADHRVGGYPSEIQWECLPVSAEDLARKYGLIPLDAANRPYDPAMTEWRLLMQVSWDTELGMEWADAGALYILIREPDARAGDFSKTVSFIHMH